MRDRETLEFTIYFVPFLFLLIISISIIFLSELPNDLKILAYLGVGGVLLASITSLIYSFTNRNSLNKSLYLVKAQAISFGFVSVALSFGTAYEALQMPRLTTESELVGKVIESIENLSGLVFGLAVISIFGSIWLSFLINRIADLTIILNRQNNELQ